MPLLEKISQASQARHWTDSIPLEFHYTTGVAGEEFRKVLKQNGRFLASTCSKCKSTYVPARMFCPDCFIEMTEKKPIDKPGYIYSFTTVEKNRAGSAIDKPVTIILVKFENVKGGIVHIFDTEESGNISFGMKVQPVVKPWEERTGALTDILAFKAA